MVISLGGYYGEHDEGGQRAYIDRYLYTLLEKLFNTLSRSPDAKITMTGSLSSFTTLEDVYYLHKNQRDKIKSAWIRRFKTIAELRNNVDTIEDMPLQKVINVSRILI